MSTDNADKRYSTPRLFGRSRGDDRVFISKCCRDGKFKQSTPDDATRNGHTRKSSNDGRRTRRDLASRFEDDSDEPTALEGEVRKTDRM